MADQAARASGVTDGEWANFNQRNPKMWPLFSHYAEMALLKTQGSVSSFEVMSRVVWAIKVEIGDKTPQSVSADNIGRFVQSFIARYPQYKDRLSMPKSRKMKRKAK
jgi:hypothetical protein